MYFVGVSWCFLRAFCCVLVFSHAFEVCSRENWCFLLVFTGCFRMFSQFSWQHLAFSSGLSSGFLLVFVVRTMN